jgi:hypothetical protein
MALDGFSIPIHLHPLTESMVWSAKDGAVVSC